MRKHYLYTTFKLRMNSFRRQRAGLEVLTKVTSKAYRWKESEKSFTKIDLLYFFNNVTFIKTSNPILSQQKEFVFNLKVVQKWRFLIDPFPANYCLALSYRRSFSCALYSDDSS